MLFRETPSDEQAVTTIPPFEGVEGGKLKMGLERGTLRRELSRTVVCMDCESTATRVKKVHLRNASACQEQLKLMDPWPWHIFN